MAVSGWLSILEMLPAIHERMMRVQVEHYDFRKVLEIYDTEETFFYCDPPYVMNSRSGSVYRHEMSDDDHKDLVEALLSIEGMAMLSGYRNELYERLEQAGWLRKDFPTVCYAAGRTRASGIRGEGASKKKVPRIESVWINPRAQARLACKNDQALLPLEA